MPEYLECLVISDTDLCKGRKSLDKKGLGGVGDKEQQKHNLT